MTDETCRYRIGLGRKKYLLHKIGSQNYHRIFKFETNSKFLSLDKSPCPNPCDEQEHARRTCDSPSACSSLWKVVRELRCLWQKSLTCLLIISGSVRKTKQKKSSVVFELSCEIGAAQTQLQNRRVSHVGRDSQGSDSPNSVFTQDHPNPISESSVTVFLEFWQLRDIPTSLGSLCHAPPQSQ